MSAWPTRSAQAPDWMEHLTRELRRVPPEYFSRFLPTGENQRLSAVLMLFGPGSDGGDGEDVVLTERSSRLRSHAGQVSFPGGRLDPADAGPVCCAMREASEEIGLSPQGVEIHAELPELGLPVSNSSVTPVLAWWGDPSHVEIRSPQEVERVGRVPLRHLLNPVNRFTVTHPSGYRGPAFATDGWFIWGFTAALLAKTFDLAGLTRPWDTNRMRPLPERYLPRTELTR